jgi:hypothetical protein
MMILIKFFYFIILMIKLNLKRNDIIVILIIFVIFSIFTYININYTYEQFASNNRELTYDSKEQYKNIIQTFYRDFYRDHLLNLQSIIENDEKIYDIIYTNGSDGFESLIYNIKTNIDEIIKFKYDNDNSNDELEVNLYKFTNNLYKLFEKTKDLFNTPEDVNSCDTLYTPTNNFLTNLESKKDVIENNNKMTLELININIKDIIEQINKINLNHDIKQEIIVNFNNYSKLINDYYGNFDNDVIKQIFDYNEISPLCHSSQTTNSVETTPDRTYKYRYNKFRININTLVKSSEDIKNKFDYYTIDELFLSEEKVIKHFETTEKNIKLELDFCKKLKKLNKPTKKNISLSRFNNDLLEQKRIYHDNLKTKIYDIQKNMSDKEIHDYNLHRIRTDDQARKQVDAIKQGIENIKNTNKLKINLV